MIAPGGTSTGSDELAVTVNEPRAVSSSPTVKPIRPVELPASTTRSPIPPISGGTVRTTLSASATVGVRVSRPSNSARCSINDRQMLVSVFEYRAPLETVSGKYGKSSL